MASSAAARARRYRARQRAGRGELVPWDGADFEPLRDDFAGTRR